MGATIPPIFLAAGSLYLLTISDAGPNMAPVINADGDAWEMRDFSSFVSRDPQAVVEFTYDDANQSTVMSLGPTVEDQWRLTVSSEGVYRFGTPIIFLDEGIITVATDIGLSEGKDFVLGSAVGTQFGTTASQKLALWGAAPVVQPVMATGTGKTVDDVITMLQSIGVCRQS